MPNPNVNQSEYAELAEDAIRGDVDPREIARGQVFAALAISEELAQIRDLLHGGGAHVWVSRDE